jgi:lipopolysaccharide/colanic/teichoic acid biosynthesis glycosyltransferase/UDP-N-acetylmuramyl pentapeptide phosphotransferase/UDP-N-acetylglucosamine-1-phosphate transferase
MIGGISFFPIILIALCISISLPYLLQIDDLRAVVEPAAMRIMQLVVGCMVLFITGLKDDLNGTGGFVKMGALLIAASMFPATGLWIDNLHGLFGIEGLSPYVGIPLTVLLVCYITEAFSLLDGIDGLSSGVGSIIIFTFLLFSIWYDSTLISFVAAAALGVAIPLCFRSFLSNRWGNTIMGNSGAYVLGYIVSYLSIGLSHSERMPDGMLMICLGALFVPMLDIIRVVNSRVRDNRTLDRPDRNQFNHKLLRTGIPRRLIPVTIAGLIGVFVVMNTSGVLFSCNPTIMVLLDIVLWVAIHLTLNYFIHEHQRKGFYKEWEKAYGEDSWYANIPHETLKRKAQTYGDMNLSQNHVVEDVAFISDGMNGFERQIKRAADMILSLLCLIIFSPLMLLSYILIKCDDGGPAIYKQQRVGRYGHPFYIYKFRSMRLDAEESGPSLSHANGDNDPRLTKVGKFLRAHHLDELPQLWNVFVGDIAFVGYRPERQFYIDQIMKEDPRYAFLYQIRPGVTSYATLYNGYTDTMEKMLRRLELDLYYLKRRSLWFDVKILGLTFLSIISGKKF